MELTRRLTITERPGYEPDGYGFARRVEDKLFGMALAINNAQLRRLRFEIQTTQTRLAEADKLIEKVLAGL